MSAKPWSSVYLIMKGLEPSDLLVRNSKRLGVEHGNILRVLSRKPRLRLSQLSSVS